MEILIQWTVWAATLGAAFWANRRLVVQLADEQAESAEDLSVAGKELAAARSETRAARAEVVKKDAEIEKLDRENFRLTLERNLRAEFAVCDACGSKDSGVDLKKTIREDRPQGRVQRIVSG